MDKNKSYLSLKKYCLSLGADLFGVADIKEAKRDFLLSEDSLNGLDRAICLGMRLAQGILREIHGAPTRLYFHHYRTLNALLDQAALKAAIFIQKKGFTAMPMPASQIVDWQNQKGHLSHKNIGYLAGLGWIGRNNLLVNKGLGSQLRIVTILTDMPLKTDKPLKTDCGSCLACLKLCPAQAIKEDPEDFNHIACFEKLKEFQRQKLVDQYICGVCVNACRGKNSF